MQIPFSDAVRMDIDIHIGHAVFFVHFFEAGQELCSVALLKAVGSQIFQNQLIPLRDTVECGTEGIPDGYPGVPGLLLTADLNAGTPGLEVLRQYPGGRIAPKSESILLLLGYKGEIPSDLPGPVRNLIKSAGSCPMVQIQLHVVFRLGTDDDITAHCKGGHRKNGNGGKIVLLRRHVLFQQGVDGAGEQPAQLHQLVQLRNGLTRFP